MQKRTHPKTASDAVGTVRWWRSLYGPCHALSGIGLSPGMMPAPPVTAPTTSALAHLAPWLTRGARARALSFVANSSCSGHSNDKANSLRHSGMCPECRKLSGLCMPSPVQEEFKPQCKASLTHTRDGGAAVAQHDGHGRALGVRGAGLDEYDGPARLRAAGGHGRARNVPDTCVFFRSCPSYGCNEPGGRGRSRRSTSKN